MVWRNGGHGSVLHRVRRWLVSHDTPICSVCQLAFPPAILYARRRSEIVSPTKASIRRLYRVQPSMTSRQDPRAFEGEEVALPAAA